MSTENVPPQDPGTGPADAVDESGNSAGGIAQYLYGGDEAGLGDTPNEHLTWYPADDNSEYTGTQDTLLRKEAKTTHNIIERAATDFQGDRQKIRALREKLWAAGLYADSTNEQKKAGMIHAGSGYQLDAWDMKALQNAQRSMTDEGVPGFSWDVLETGESFLDQMADKRNLSAFAEGVAEVEYGPTSAAIEQWMDRNGLNITRQRLDTLTRQVVDGDTQLSDVFKAYTQSRLIPSYGAYANQMEASLNDPDGNYVDAFTAADPYIATAQQLLEMPEGSMGLDDPLIMDAMTYANDKGEPVQMGLTEFKDRVKSDERWEYTDNAHEEIGSKMSWFDDLFGI